MATKTPEFNNATKYENDAVLWQDRYRVAYNNQISMFKRFADWYDDMYSVVQAKNYALWRSKVYIPILGSKAWNLIAKFVSIKPGFEVRVRQDGMEYYDLGPDDEPIEDKAEKATLKLEYDYDNPRLDKPMRSKLMSCLVDACVTGTGLAKVPWNTHKRVRYEHPIKSDGTIDMANEKVTTTTEGYNDLIPVNIFNVFMSPTANDLQTADWVIIKEYKTLDQLQDTNSAKGVEVYKNLDSLKNARSTSDPMAIYKQSRNRLTVQQDPILVDKTIDYLDIYECYDKANGTIKTYANAGTDKSNTGTNWIEIRSQNNPYWHGKYPLVRFTIKERPYDFWGQGVFETSQTLQRAANDVFNHYMDNWNLSVDGMLMAQESAGINDYIVEPGGLLTYRTEKPDQFKFPEPNPASLNMIFTKMMAAIEGDTISGYSSGDSASAVDKTRGTKGGIEAIQEAGDDMVSFMRANFQETVKQIGQMWLSNNQQFMIKPLNINVTKKGQNKNVKITPQDLQGDMELRVDDASMMPISDDQMKQNFVAFTQQLSGLAQASVQQHNLLGTQPFALNYPELADEMAEKFGFRNAANMFDKIPAGPTPAQQQQQMQMQHEQMLKASTAPKAPQLQERMIESLSYKDAPPDIQRQMEQQAGFQPSQAGMTIKDAIAHQGSQNNALATLGQAQNQHHQTQLQAAGQLLDHHMSTQQLNQQAAEAEMAQQAQQQAPQGGSQ